MLTAQSFPKKLSKKPLSYCNCRISAATASVLLAVYSPYTPSSSVLVSLEILQFRYEEGFLDSFSVICFSEPDMVQKVNESGAFHCHSPA